MAKKTIASIDCEIPGGLSEFISFDSNTSLLDWDIILFNPSIVGYTFSAEKYQGKPCLNDDRSFQLREYADHWRRELSNAYDAGKTIYVILSDFNEVFIGTGKREHSGTGRNRQTTRIVTEFNNYYCLPFQIEVTPSHGKAMKLSNKGTFLSEYWMEFGGYSEYKVLLSGKIGESMVLTKSGSKTVGSLIQHPNTAGCLVLLPYLNLWSEEFYDEIEVPKEDITEDDEDSEDETQVDMVWTEKGTKFGHKFLNCIIEIDRVLKKNFAVTPAPKWTQNTEYDLPKETKYREKLFSLEKKIEKLNKDKEELKDKISDEGLLRRLLYEKGKVLEASVLQVLKIIGFKSEQYHDSESEFDVVFESAEGRFLGEVEGKDNKPINIDKFRQLEMNIHEDFDRENVNEMAKGVLLGNAYRLKPLDQCKEYFTKKCFKASMRSGAALVRTPDLFTIAKYLSENNDKSFAKKCRKAILETEGDIVKFPETPRKIQETIRKVPDA